LKPAGNNRNIRKLCIGRKEGRKKGKRSKQRIEMRKVIRRLKRWNLKDQIDSVKKEDGGKAE